MKQTLRTLTCVAMVAWLTGGAGEGSRPALCQQPPSAASTPTDELRLAARSSPDNPPSRGQQLVAAAARQMAKEPSLEAKIRHRVNVGGHELFGTGIYQQLGEGDEKLLRLELKTQLDDQTVTLQQLCSDRFFWIRKDLPQGGKSLSRVSLWQLRDALRRADEVKNIAEGNRWMMLGGLSRLLEELNRAYVFKPPQPGKLGTVPVWVIAGQASPEFCRRMDIPADQDPPQFASQVIVTIGRDEILPLFPYRIEYLRGRGEDVKPLMSMELYEVRRRSDLDPRSFEYNPGDQEVEDITKACLVRLGLQ